MLHFTLNGQSTLFEGNPEISLLNFLRNFKNITSVKDGCSCQGACGACMVEINGEAKLACLTRMKNVENAQINTLEGLPSQIRDILAKAFVEKGAVQCGFCTPGFLMRTNVLLRKNPSPSRDEIKQALTLNLCRCTGYVKIIDAIHEAAQRLKNETATSDTNLSGMVGTSYPKYEAYEMALGKRLFVNDLHFDNMLHAALFFPSIPRRKFLLSMFRKPQNWKA
ncbi:MAG: 2Fe-2S iron-sulfur cluster-binding protein [Bacteroidales bacterium]